jgi:hypothetical protein
LHVCKRNSNAKHLATLFFGAARGSIGDGGACGIHMAAGSENSNTITKMMDSLWHIQYIAYILGSFILFT